MAWEYYPTLHTTSIMSGLGILPHTAHHQYYVWAGNTTPHCTPPVLCLGWEYYPHYTPPVLCLGWEYYPHCTPPVLCLGWEYYPTLHTTSIMSGLGILPHTAHHQYYVWAGNTIPHCTPPVLCLGW